MNLKFLTKFLILGAAILSLSGCASIVNNKTETFSITSDPSSANIIVTDSTNGNIIIRNQTPFTITLDKKAGYFKGKSYIVKVSKEGFNDVDFDIKSTVSGWYIGGNIVFGGLIGWLIVDPLTGSMWVLEPKINDNITVNEQIISVKLLSDLTDEQKAKMVAVK